MDDPLVPESWVVFVCVEAEQFFDASSVRVLQLIKYHLISQTIHITVWQIMCSLDNSNWICSLVSKVAQLFLAGLS